MKFKPFQDFLIDDKAFERDRKLDLLLGEQSDVVEGKFSIWEGIKQLFKKQNKNKTV